MPGWRITVCLFLSLYFETLQRCIFMSVCVPRIVTEWSWRRRLAYLCAKSINFATSRNESCDVWGRLSVASASNGAFTQRAPLRGLPRPALYRAFKRLTAQSSRTATLFADMNLRIQYGRIKTKRFLSWLTLTIVVNRIVKGLEVLRYSGYCGSRKPSVTWWAWRVPPPGLSTVPTVILNDSVTAAAFCCFWTLYIALKLLISYLSAKTDGYNFGCRHLWSEWFEPYVIKDFGSSPYRQLFIQWTRLRSS